VATLTLSQRAATGTSIEAVLVPDDESTGGGGNTPSGGG